MDKTVSLPWEDKPSRVNGKRAVFLADAVQRYLQGSDQSIITQTAIPRGLLYLWLLLLLLLAVGLLIGITLNSTLHAGAWQLTSN